MQAVKQTRGEKRRARLLEAAKEVFLERGFDAFGQLGDAKPFLADIRASETRVMRRLFAGDADPFRD